MRIEEYSQLYAVIKFIFGISVFFGVFGWLIAFISQFEKKYLKYKKAGVLLILNAIVLGFLTLGVYTKLFNSIRNEIITILEDPATEIHQKGYTFGKLSSSEFKIEIIKIRHYDTHHSGYGECMNLIIINKNLKSFHLTVCRDTQITNEYWVFTDKYPFIEPDVEIGRFHSDILK